MAYAPYTNDQRGDLAPTNGSFTECEAGHTFEWFSRNSIDRDLFAAEFPHRIWVGPGMDGEGDTRIAKVCKTFALIVIDEAADGSPITEEWAIKGHRVYATGNAAPLDGRVRA